MNKKCNDVIVIGFALFAMFFGAGNLLLPPALGHLSGRNWVLAFSGFLLTGVGMPILGIVSMGKCGGRLSDFIKNINGIFGTFFIIFVMLIIGPLFALPRLAATTFEIAVAPMKLGINSVFFSLIFFGITLFFVLTPTNVVDRVGKILTPALIIMTAMFIVKGVMTPIGKAAAPSADKLFLRGFKEGYQTMDALASIIFATIAISAIGAKGYGDRKSLFQMSVYTGMLACFGLALVYGGLMYVGATGSRVLPEQLSRSAIVVRSSELLWGSWGRVVLGLAIGLACLTTAIGLIATVGKYFSERFRNDISYRAAVIIITVISFFLSIFGVDAIIYVAGPILEIVYPVAIVLIIMNLFSDYIPNRYFYGGAVFGTLCISVLQGIVAAEDLINGFLVKIGAMPMMGREALSFNTTVSMLRKLPLERIGVPWLLPAIAASLLFGFGFMLLEKTKKAPSIHGGV